MSNLDFSKMRRINSTYGKKDIDEAIKATEENKGLIEVARRLADK